MTNKESVFEKTYEDYLAQVSGIDFNSIKQQLQRQDLSRIKVYHRIFRGNSRIPLDDLEGLGQLLR